MMEAKPATLLLVDPDPLLRWSVETHLRGTFDVVAVATPEQAESLAAQRSFDAVVLSAALAVSARPLVASVRASNPRVRIVWLTTGNESARRDPTAAYIEKPFRLSALADVVTPRRS